MLHCVSLVERANSN